MVKESLIDCDIHKDFNTRFIIKQCDGVSSLCELLELGDGDPLVPPCLRTVEGHTGKGTQALERIG